MAGPAKNPAAMEVYESPAPLPDPMKEQGKAEIVVDEIQAAAARLYGLGYKRAQIARILFDHLAPLHREGKRDRTVEERQSLARNKLRRWERTQKFRDLIWNQAVVELDLETPAILKGVASKAKRGRTDAARLALEVTGRHNPKGEDKPTEIVVHIGNIPRPG